MDKVGHPGGLSQAEPHGVSSLRASIPDADDGAWFCERGNFWGTVSQLLLCAKCGQHEFKRHDEPRHFRGICTPGLHMICDECYDALPDDEPSAQAIEAQRVETEGLDPKDESAVRQDAPDTCKP